jgi:hypothetical protein
LIVSKVANAIATVIPGYNPLKRVAEAAVYGLAVDPMRSPNVAASLRNGMIKLAQAWLLFFSHYLFILAR